MSTEVLVIASNGTSTKSTIPGFDPAAVAITGGTIDGTVIGGVDPREATFLDLTTNGLHITSLTSPAPVTSDALTNAGNIFLQNNSGTSSTGNVQIGDGLGANPENNTRLQVFGTSSSTKQLRLGAGNSFFWDMGRDNASTGDFTLGNGTDRVRVTSAGNVTITGGLLIESIFTVGTLPAGVAAGRCFVTDALSPLFGSPVVAGGSPPALTPVYYDNNSSAYIVG